MAEGVSTVVREFSLILLSVLACPHPATSIYIFIANSVHLVNGNQKGYAAL